jgi:serine/threonine protein kinase
MLSPGDKIGSYTIRELAGAGGMATVYKAWHEGLHRHEALKVPRGAGEGSADSAYVLRLLSEARVAAQLHHPNIVTIYNISEVDAAIPFFAMDWVNGEDLSQILKFKRQFSLRETIEILQPVAQALDYAHSQNVVHRDVKPANILLESKDGVWTPHVVDFGISRAAEDEDGATKLTKSGMLVGTPEYMSPEQAGSGEPVDFRTDIYSLGVVAYEMLCGIPPFTAGPGVSRLSILIAHVNKPVPLFQIRPDFPRRVGELLLRTLAKSPKDRPQSCNDFINELKAVSTEISDSDLLPLISNSQDIRTPFDASRFDIDNDATLIHRIADEIEPEKLLVPETLTSQSRSEVASSNLASPITVKHETKTLNETISSVNDGDKNKTIPVSPISEIITTPETFQPPIKKSAVSKIVIFSGGALITMIGIVAFTSFSMKSLQIPNESTIVDNTPSPAKVTISTPTIEAEKKPEPTSHMVLVTRMREIPFQTETRYSRRRTAGQKSIIQQGRLGTREVKLSITMKGKQEITRKLVSERSVLQPVTQIIEIGTRRRVMTRPPQTQRKKSDSENKAATTLKNPVKPVKKTPERHPIREAPLPP